MQRVDFRKELKHLYRSSPGVIGVVNVPPTNFLMVAGQGDANGSLAYASAVATLFAVSSALKFKVKQSEVQVDYSVLPLTGLW